METTLAPQPSQRRRRITVWLAAALCLITALSAVLFVIYPPMPMVNYYGEVMPQREFEAQGSGRICVQMPVPEPSVLFQWLDFLTRQPAFNCFDTDAEASEWMRGDTSRPPEDAAPLISHPVGYPQHVTASRVIPS